MNELIAKCGCNCSQCPTFKDNLQTFEDRKRCSWGWKKYLNIKLSPEKLRLCDGCSISDDKRKVYYLNCYVRKCAMKNGVKNCAYCSAYPCQEVLAIHSLQKLDAKELSNVSDMKYQSKITWLLLNLMKASSTSMRSAKPLGRMKLLK